MKKVQFQRQVLYHITSRFWRGIERGRSRNTFQLVSWPEPSCTPFIERSLNFLIISSLQYEVVTFLTFLCCRDRHIMQLLHFGGHLSIKSIRCLLFALTE